MITQRIKPILKKYPLEKVGVFCLTLSALLALYAPFLASPVPFLRIDSKGLCFPFLSRLLAASHYPFLLDRLLNACALLAPFVFLIKPLKRVLPLRASFFSVFICALFLASFFSAQTHFKPSSLTPSKVEVQFSALIPHHPDQMVWKNTTSKPWLEKTTASGQNLLARTLFGMRYSYALALCSCLIAFLLGCIWVFVRVF